MPEPTLPLYSTIPLSIPLSQSPSTTDSGTADIIGALLTVKMPLLGAASVVFPQRPVSLRDTDEVQLDLFPSFQAGYPIFFLCPTFLPEFISYDQESKCNSAEAIIICCL